jgi:hypothetical protein
MAGRKNSGKTVLGQLKTSQDFNELLSLSELDIQMEVLGFLQENLFDYQMNYLKSFLKTIDEAIEYIPEKDYTEYFNRQETGDTWEKKKGVWEYKNDVSVKDGVRVEPVFMGIEKVLEYYKDPCIKIPIVVYNPDTGRPRAPKEFKKESIDSTNLFIVDPSIKKIYHVNKQLIPGFKFLKKNKTLVCSSKYREISGSTAPFNKGYHSTTFYEFTVSICLKTNSIESVKKIQTGSKSVYVGWASNARDIKDETIYGD